MIKNQVLKYKNPFKLESGETLPELQLFYTTSGNPNGPVIWLCHPFTGGSDFTQWWSGFFGPGKLWDPAKYFLVCSNVIGGCYGSTGPKSFYFPLITHRDIIRGFSMIKNYLKIEKIHTISGVSMGGQQAIEWAIEEPHLFNNLIGMGCNAQSSPWMIAFNEAQRMALRSGPEGIKTARAIGMLSYKSHDWFELKQSEKTDEKLNDFKASSYQQYQGEKLQKRFSPYTYWTLSKAIDSHNVGRGRESISQALNKIKARTLFLGIDSDILFPYSEQEYLANKTNGEFRGIRSPFGHDGFLIEFKVMSKIIKDFYKNI